MRPLAVDLCCGLGGFTAGLLAEGWDVVGFDIERHIYGEHRYPAQLVLQDVLTLSGKQFRGKVSLVVASPPCQKYSYMAMPWTRAKTLQAWYRDQEHPERIVELNAIFDACVRIGTEAGCPTIIENVRGAQKWVGRARWNFGSFYLWGDVPALMPVISRRAKLKGGDVGWRGTGPGRQLQDHAIKVGGLDWKHPDDPRHRPGQAFNTTAEAAIKQHGSGRDWREKALDERRKEATAIKYGDGVKVPGGGAEGWFGTNPSPMRRHHSGSTSRKFASAMIAKIPLPLARHIARSFLPRRDRFGVDIEPSRAVGYTVA